MIMGRLAGVKMSIGIPGLILIVIVVLILFGPTKLPQLSQAIGKSLKEFKKATNEATDNDLKEDDQAK